MQLVRVAFIAALMLSVSPVRSAPIAYEPFTGAPGNSIFGTNGGTGWTGAWANPPTNGTITFAAQNLSYNAGQLAIDGGGSAALVTVTANANNLFGSRGFVNQTGTVYFSFLFRTATSAGPNNDFFQFGLDSGNVNPRVSLGHSSTDTTSNTNTEFFSRAGTDPNDSAFSGVDTFIDTTYFVVGRATRGTGNYNNVTLYFNPTTATEPVSGVTSSVDSGVANLNTFVFRIARSEAGDSFLFDELRIGTTYADVVVVAPIPEPWSALLLGAAGLSAVVWLRRRRRAAA